VLLTAEIEKLPASSLFIFIGAQPRTEWLDGLIKRDEPWIRSVWA